MVHNQIIDMEEQKLAGINDYQAATKTPKSHNRSYNATSAISAIQTTPWLDSSSSSNKKSSSAAFPDTSSFSNSMMLEDSSSLRETSGTSTMLNDSSKKKKKKKEGKKKKKKKSSGAEKQQQQKQSPKVIDDTPITTSASEDFLEEMKLSSSNGLDAGASWGNGTNVWNDGDEEISLGGFSTSPSQVPTTQELALNCQSTVSPVVAAPPVLHMSTDPASLGGFPAETAVDLGGFPDTPAAAGAAAASRPSAPPASPYKNERDAPPFGIINDIQSFVDENMSVLTDHDHHFSTSSFALPASAKSQHSSNPGTNTTASSSIRRVSAISGLSGDSEQVPHDLLVNYMLAMGANRENAEDLALGFTLEQQQQRQQPNFASASTSGRYAQPAAIALSSKLEEAERGNQQRSFQRQPSNNNGLLSDTSYSISDQLSHGSSFGHFQKEESSPSPFSKMLEARPVARNMESELPVVYADSSPASFKYLLSERPVRRIFCMLLLVVVGVVVFIVVYFTVIKQPAAAVIAPDTTEFPTMSPSIAPTFLSEEILTAAAQLSGWNAMADTASPQLRAVSWMSAFDQIETGGYRNQRFAQRYALIVMYYSFKGEDWIIQEKWLRPDLHECEWSGGISCFFDVTKALKVSGFDATRNNLQGTMPREIGLLTDAGLFRIPKNKVAGSIPDSIGKMISLSVIDMSDNALTGRIPSALAGARDLIQVDLSQNQLNSFVPDELYSLSLLRTLVLKSNQLSGTLSSTVQNLESLVKLDLRENQISGKLPFSLDSMLMLDIVLLDNNLFTGSLPIVTGQLAKKQILSLSHNRLSGNLDADITAFNITDFRLHHVDLSHNLLSGPISPLFMYLPSFRHFDMSGNALSGTFPSNVGWENLEFLAMANNALTGTVPVGYPSLSKLLGCWCNNVRITYIFRALTVCLLPIAQPTLILVTI